MIGIVSAAGLLDGMLASPLKIAQPSLGILLLGQISSIALRFALVSRNGPGRTGLLLIAWRDRVVVSLRMSHALTSWGTSLSRNQCSSIAKRRCFDAHEFRSFWFRALASGLLD
jgi:hypothetical protein